MICEAVQHNQKPAEGNSGASPNCFATSVGCFIGVDMRKIPLTKGKFALIDDEDFGRVAKYSWYAHPSKNQWYAVRTQLIAGIRQWIPLARFIMKTPFGAIVDHINHDGLDNRKINLRTCTPLENSANRAPRATGSSKYKGVRVRIKSLGGYIHAQIGYNGKFLHLGTFGTEIDAAMAYDKAATELYGVFAYINFPRKTNL